MVKRQAIQQRPDGRAGFKGKMLKVGACGGQEERSSGRLAAASAHSPQLTAECMGNACEVCVFVWMWM